MPQDLGFFCSTFSGLDVFFVFLRVENLKRNEWALFGEVHVQEQKRRCRSPQVALVEEDKEECDRF